MGPQLLDGLGYGLDVDDLAVAHRAIGEGNLAELGEGDLPFPNESSAARTPEVPMSRPMADRPATTPTLPAGSPEAA